MSKGGKIKGKKASFPSEIKPMLATLVDKPFHEAGWIYEIKWDGYRAISYLDKGKAEIRSRNNKVFNEKFYPVFDALKKLRLNAVIDGEIIVMNDKGFADFSDLQGWRSEADGRLVYYVFDILWLDGIDLTNEPLINRHEILKNVLPDNNPVIKVSEIFHADGKEIFQIASKMNLEGIMAKKSESKYLPGIRTMDWLKVKTEQRQEVVIGGYTINEGSSKLFSALLVGVFEKNDFKFLGSVGTGFNLKTQEEIIKKLKSLLTKKCPFSEVPEYNKPSRFRPNPPPAKVFWVKPQVVAEISYRELTKDNALRHPSFKGLREDKNVKNVILEKPAMPKKVSGNMIPGKEKKIVALPAKRERATLLNPKDETQVRKIGKHELKFTNLSKVFWPDEKITKRDMLNYYYMAAPYMLPYMKDRPQTLFRHPHGIKGEAFYQKDVTGKVPSWIKTFPYFSEADDRQKHFLVCDSEESLLYIASLGCIEMNPWSSRVQSPDNPDWCIIDLDPDKNTFDQVITAARVTHDILESAGITSFCKTSGSTGLHIYIPLGSAYTYEDSKEFSRVVARLVHKEIPSFTSIERNTKDRKGKMYIDFLQNRPQATVAAPYSLRPKPGATVSMPLLWEEVKKGLKMSDFSIRNAVSRIRETGDLFKGVLGKKINLEKAKTILGKTEG
jgi:bifunctional non-homologous end joining protein LigD